MSAGALCVSNSKGGSRAHPLQESLLLLLELLPHDEAHEHAEIARVGEEGDGTAHARQDGALEAVVVVAACVLARWGAEGSHTALTVDGRAASDTVSDTTRAMTHVLSGWQQWWQFLRR